MLKAQVSVFSWVMSRVGPSYCVPRNKAQIQNVSLKKKLHSVAE